MVENSTVELSTPQLFSSGNLDHQRAHFDMLSINMKDLIAIAGADRKLYQEYCPMYNDGDGAMWLSESS